MCSSLLYLRDATVLVAIARVHTVRFLTDGQVAVIANQTPFYPQGGGQPGDRGSIHGEFGVSPVLDTRLHQGEVLHLCRGQEFPSVGETVRLLVDADQRRLHARLHTAGELICAAMRSVPAVGEVVRAMHFPGSSLVEFALRLPAPELIDLTTELEQTLTQLVIDDHPIEIVPNVDRASAEAETGQHLAHLPEDESIRLVRPCPGFARACKGTHLQRTGETGVIKILKVHLRKGRLHVSYTVD